MSPQLPPPSHSSGRLGMPVLPYPGCRYHKTLPMIIVNNKAEDDALGSDYAHVPFPAEPVQAELDKDAQIKELQAKHDALLKQIEALKEPAPLVAAVNSKGK